MLGCTIAARSGAWRTGTLSSPFSRIDLMLGYARQMIHVNREVDCAGKSVIWRAEVKDLPVRRYRTAGCIQRPNVQHHSRLSQGPNAQRISASTAVERVGPCKARFRDQRIVAGAAREGKHVRSDIVLYVDAEVRGRRRRVDRADGDGVEGRVGDGECGVGVDDHRRQILRRDAVDRRGAAGCANCERLNARTRGQSKRSSGCPPLTDHHPARCNGDGDGN